MKLRIQNLSKSFGDKILFQKTGFIIQDQERVAIVGQNGTGKTTFIKCLTGEEEFEGTIEFAPETKISVMEQEKNFDKQHTTFAQYLNEKFNKIENELRQYEDLLGDESLYENTEKFTKICNEYEVLCRQVDYKIEEQTLRNLLVNLAFPVDKLESPINNLSGGEKAKLRIAEVLATDAQILILDEPTNHLDLKTRRFLEQYLIETQKTIFVVSHDRYFLQKIVTKVVEIENKEFQVYDMQYSKYIEEKKKHIEVLQKEHDATSKKRKKLLESCKEKRKWAHVNGDSRTKKLADRLQRDADNLKQTVDPKLFKQVFKLDFDYSKESSNVVYEAKQVSKRFGAKIVLREESFEIRKKDRIAVIGENGCGKTTLLKILANITQPDGGEVREGYNLQVGYFDQELSTFKKSKKLIDFFLESFVELHDAKIAQLAMQFGFSSDKFKTRLNMLSGGEKARINLVRLMSKKHNVLILDEPTNNLDVELIEMLEQALVKYPGTVIFVSHDRHFIDKVATKVLRLEDGKIDIRSGNYTVNF